MICVKGRVELQLWVQRVSDWSARCTKADVCHSVFGGYGEDDNESARQERLQGGGRKKQAPQVCGTL